MSRHEVVKVCRLHAFQASMNRGVRENLPGHLEMVQGVTPTAQEGVRGPTSLFGQCSRLPGGDATPDHLLFFGGGLVVGLRQLAEELILRCASQSRRAG